MNPDQPGFGRAARASLAVLVLLPSAFALPGVAQEQGRPTRVGEVHTIAGPGLCDGPSRIDRASIRAVAAAGGGRVLIEGAGQESRGVTTVDGDREVEQFRLGPAADETTSNPVVQEARRIKGTGLAWHGGPSALAVQGNQVVEVGSREPIAGIGGSEGPSSIGADGSEGASATGAGGAAPPVFTGDSGPAVDAGFGSMRSIATDRAGNLFVADATSPNEQTFRIRFVNRSPTARVLVTGTAQEVSVAPGAITTVRGNEADASVDTLQGSVVAMAAQDDLLYVATTSYEQAASAASRSRLAVHNLGVTAREALGTEVEPGATAMVLADAPSSARSGAGTGEDRLGLVTGLAIDQEGSLYLAEPGEGRVRRIDATGAITTFAGAGAPAALDDLVKPSDVAVGTDGSVYIVDPSENEVVGVDPGGLVTRRRAGLANQAVCLEPNDRVQSGNIISVASANADAVYMTGNGFPQVKRVDSSGTVTNVAGFTSSEPCSGWPPGCPTRDGVPADTVLLDRPTALAAVEEGVYVVDGGHRSVRFVNTGPRSVSRNGRKVQPGHIVTVAGPRPQGDATQTPGDAAEPPGGAGEPLGLAAELTPKTTIAADGNGALFVASPEERTIWRIDSKGRAKAVITVAEGQEDTCCTFPSGLAATAEGNLFVLDRNTRRVWFLNLGDSEVTALGQVVPPGALQPIAGSGEEGVSGENTSALATDFLSPTAIAAGPDGVLHVVDNEDNTVRKFDRFGIGTTAMGTGNIGSEGDGLPGGLTTLGSPNSATVDRCGNLIVNDAVNDRVRRLNQVATCGPAPVVATGSDRTGWFAVGIAAATALVARSLWTRRRRSRSGPTPASSPD